MQVGPSSLSIGKRNKKPRVFDAKLERFEEKNSSRHNDQGLQAKARMAQDANATYNPYKDYRPSNTCLLNTGASCETQPCAESLGAEVCLWGRCVCTAGCATASGTCAAGAYTILHDNFTMYDMRFGRYLFVDNEMWHISMTKYDSSEYNRFTLVQTRDGKQILYSKGDPNFAVAVEGMMNPQTLRPSGSFEVQQAEIRAGWGNIGFVPSVPNVALTLTEPPGGYDDVLRPEGFSLNGTYPVMLQSFKFPRHFIFSPYWGMLGLGNAEVNYDDPGDGALWLMDPPLPQEYITGAKRIVQPYVGTRCSFDCHGAGANPDSALFALLTVVLLACACGSCLLITGIIKC